MSTAPNTLIITRQDVRRVMQPSDYRAAVELGKEWRTDKYLRQLNALLAVCDQDMSLLIAGTGEIIEPEDGILAIGSGGSFALAAARSLVKHTDLGAEDIVRESLLTAAEICIYTNTNINIETLRTRE